MAKLPKYMKIEPLSNGLKPSISFNVVIKRWGIPILAFNAMREFEGLRWYHWLLFPKICIKAMRGGLNEY